MSSSTCNHIRGTDGKVLKDSLDEWTDMGSSVSSSEGTKAFKLDGLLESN